MEKIISRDQVLALGFLLGFEKVTDRDLVILITDYLEKNRGYSYSILMQSNLGKYLDSLVNGKKLKEGLTLQSYLQEENTSVRKYLTRVAGDHFQRYSTSFNLEEFMLRKIDNHCFSEESIPYSFCEKQQQKLRKMEKKGYIVKSWNDDIPHQDYLQYQLSNIGRLKLYKIKYPKELQAFVKLLHAKKYDIGLLDDFLLTQDLTKSPDEILTITNFQMFCSIHDRAIEQPKQFTKRK